MHVVNSSNLTENLAVGIFLQLEYQILIEGCDSDGDKNDN